MTLQFQHLLAGKRMGGDKMQGDAFVDRFAIAIEKTAERGTARRGQTPEHRLRKRGNIGPRDPYHPHPAAPGRGGDGCDQVRRCRRRACHRPEPRSEEHTSELQSLMRTSYAVFCLK